MIFVLAGTLEGRNTAGLLQQNGFTVAASAVTPYGARLLEMQGINHVYTGPLNGPALQELLQRGCRLLVDATHPFATLASETAMEAAGESGVPYLRLERPATRLPVHPLVHAAGSLEDCINKALSLGRVLFSTLGSKNLPSILPPVRAAGAKVVARVLPDSQVISRCCEWGLSPDEIIALRGPCSNELNKVLYREYGAQVILTKDSGDTGGVVEKITAAVELGLPVVVWQRPKLHYPRMVDSPDKVLEFCLTNLGELTKEDYPCRKG